MQENKKNSRWKIKKIESAHRIVGGELKMTFMQNTNYFERTNYLLITNETDLIPFLFQLLLRSKEKLR